MESKSENTGEFIRRKFTLTHEVNNLIDELAEDNHGGNRSACVRAAVYAMHQRRDEDELRHGLKRLQKDIEALTEQVNSLQETQTRETSFIDQNQAGETNPAIAHIPTEGGSIPGSDTESPVRVAREVYSVMRNEEQTVFALEDLLTEIEYSLSSVAAGIDRLVEQDAVEQLNTDGHPQYRLVTT